MEQLKKDLDARFSRSRMPWLRWRWNGTSWSGTQAGAGGMGEALRNWNFSARPGRLWKELCAPPKHATERFCWGRRPDVPMGRVCGKSWKVSARHGWPRGRAQVSRGAFESDGEFSAGRADGTRDAAQGIGGATRSAPGSGRRVAGSGGAAVGGSFTRLATAAVQALPTSSSL